MKSIPVIVDEMNIVHQMNRLNVHHVSWTSFYSALRHMTGAKINPYFACANICTANQFYEKRKSFFHALDKRGITVLEGFSVLDSNNRRTEKGVDVLVALQIYKAALAGAKDIIVCSADSDLIPAIKDAQKLGVRVHVVLSDFAPSKDLSYIADRIIRLETILEMVIERGNAQFKDKSKPYLFSHSNKNYAECRHGLA